MPRLRAQRWLLVRGTLVVGAATLLIGAAAVRAQESGSGPCRKGVATLRPDIASSGGGLARRLKAEAASAECGQAITETRRGP